MGLDDGDGTRNNIDVVHQDKLIQDSIDFLVGEDIVNSKYTALYWIYNIGLNYGGSQTIEDFKKLVDEMMAYAWLGLKEIE
jgi:hypothetical protein